MAVTISAVIIAVLVGGAVVGMYQSISSMEKRIAKLEEANVKRINYRSLDELENMMAGIVLLENKADFEKMVIDNIRAHAERARNPNPKK
jgi:hypothetical protein